MRRLLFVVVALFAVLIPARALATTPPNGSGDGTTTTDAAPDTTIDNSFLDTKRELSQCLNNSIDLPDCGIEPTQPGDRGGVLQGVTFGVLTLGIVIISWRVVRSIRARDAAVGSRAS
jgi:hypothetical protein